MSDEFPLFIKFPELKEKVLKLDLGNFPTPVKELINFKKVINSTNNIYIKRDDLSSSIYGGNKVRKLEFTLANVINKNSKRIITAGGIGSNMTVAVSAFGEQYNIKVDSFLFDQPINTYNSINFAEKFNLTDYKILPSQFHSFFN